MQKKQGILCIAIYYYLKSYKGLGLFGIKLLESQFLARSWANHNVTSVLVQPGLAANPFILFAIMFP